MNVSMTSCIVAGPDIDAGKVTKNMLNAQIASQRRAQLQLVEDF